MSTKSSAAALLAAVFFAGVAGTLGVLRIVEHREEPAAWAPRNRPGPERFPGRMPGGAPGPFSELARMEFTERLADRLELTEDQRTRLEEVMDARRERTEELMRTVLPLLRGQTDSLQAEIEDILTPEQLETFRAFEDRARFRGRRGQSGRRPRPQ